MTVHCHTRRSHIVECRAVAESSTIEENFWKYDPGNAKIGWWRRKSLVWSSASYGLHDEGVLHNATRM